MMILITVIFSESEVSKTVETKINTVLRQELKLLVLAVKVGLRVKKGVRVIVKLARNTLCEGSILLFKLTSDKSDDFSLSPNSAKSVLMAMHEFCNLHEVPFEVWIPNPVSGILSQLTESCIARYMPEGQSSN
jgi:hypothetical protein